jgi:hypothetical protein
MRTELLSRRTGLPEKIRFRVVSKLNRQITTTQGYWNIITNLKHPSIKGKENEIKEALRNPDSIRQSYTDKKVYLFYKKYGRNYLCVIVRHLNGKGFIITAYLTNKIKEGRQIWQKK